MDSPWVNIDNVLGIACYNAPNPHRLSSKIAFGDRANNNSIMTAKLYTLFSNEHRIVNAGDVVDCRAVIYYSNIDAATTARLAAQNTMFTTTDGWQSVTVYDPDGTAYQLRANFRGDNQAIGSLVTSPKGVAKEK